MSNTLIFKGYEKRVNRQCCRAYALGIRVGHGLHKPVELIAHRLRGDASGGAFEMLGIQKT